MYLEKKEQEEIVNKAFSDRYPHLSANLLFSSIVHRVRELAQVVLEEDLEPATLVFAVVFLERLCALGVVTERNLALSTALCLFLAFKFVEPTAEDKSTRRALYRHMDAVWAVSYADVLRFEFGAYSLLDFSLHLPAYLVRTHFGRILALLSAPFQNMLKGKAGVFW